MTFARRSLPDMQQRLSAARLTAERVWYHWFAVCATVPVFVINWFPKRSEISLRP